MRKKSDKNKSNEPIKPIDPDSPNERAKKVMAEILLLVGTAVKVDESIYEWEDAEAESHVWGYDRPDHDWSVTKNERACKWVIPENPDIEELYVTEWGGTFGSDTQEARVQINSVSCSCGKIENQTVRYSGTFSEFLSMMISGELKTDPRW